jgi:hypothetical protein
MKNQGRDNQGKFIKTGIDAKPARIILRVSTEMKSKLEAIPDYPEKLRILIQQWLDSIE